MTPTPDVASVRRALAPVATGLLVLNADGTVHCGAVAIEVGAAILRELPAGSCLVDAEGVVLAYSASDMSTRQAEKLARAAAACWRSRP